MTEYVIYACTEPGCGYYRDSLTTGVNVTHTQDPDRAKGFFKDELHKIAPLVVVGVDVGCLWKSPTSHRQPTSGPLPDESEPTNG